MRRAFVGLTFVTGAAVIAAAVMSLTTRPIGWHWLLLAAVTWLSAPFALKVPGAPLMLTISESLSFVIAIGAGWEAAVVTVAVDGLLASLRQKNRRIERSLFNVTEPALSMLACVLVLDWLSGMSAAERMGAPLAQLIVPGFVATSTYLLFNSSLTATAIALEAGSRLGSTWRRHANLLVIDHLAGTSLALLVISGARGSGLAGAFAALPLLGALYVTYRTAIRRADDALEYAERLNRLYLGTVESLAMAIDAKDHVTHGHITRVCSLALRVAEAMNLRDERLAKALEAGALLHDVGKLGVPDHILNKPGPLTPTEYEQIKQHTVVGAEIVSRVDYPYPVAPIVRHHHENWDGTGYPDGLIGLSIPIGARILSVIDCYDALTSDRPYRRAMTHDAAMLIILERRGTMYDPKVVDAFAVLAASTHAAAPVAQAPAPARTLHQARATTEQVLAAVPDRATNTPDVDGLVRTVSTLARHHDYRDLMDVLGPHLLRLTPASSVALFIAEPSGTGLRFGWATGALSAALAALHPALGQGPSGWVAAHRAPLLNAAAALEFQGATDPGVVPTYALSTAIEAQTGQVKAVLTLYSDQQAFSQADLELLQTLTATLAPSVGRDPNHERLAS